jgi:hypothetical protein
MAFNIRKVPDAIVFGLVAAHNKGQEERVASFFHADVTSVNDSAEYQSPTVTPDTITAAASSSEATAVALANDAKAVINRHFADTFAHDSAVSAQMTTASATNLATAVTLANAIKAAYNAHRTASNVHFTNDATNAVAASDATDQTSVNTLLNEIKSDFNAHVVSAPAGAMVRLIPA